MSVCELIIISKYELHEHDVYTVLVGGQDAHDGHGYGAQVLHHASVEFIRPTVEPMRMDDGRGNDSYKATRLCALSTTSSRGLDGVVIMRACGDADGRGEEPCGPPRTGR